MVLCKFFMQGNCRYGDRCWNEHPRGGGQDYNSGFGGARQTNKPVWTGGGNRFGALANQPIQQGSSNANVSPLELIQIIAEDANVWSRSNMWPFSCYRVKKEGPFIPGFDDVSPDELRFEAYTAEKNGTIQSYVTKVTGLAAEYVTKRDTLRQQGPQIKQKLLQIIQDHEKQMASGSSTTSSAFGGQPSTQTNSAGLFGKSQTNSGTFGQGGGAGGLFGQGAATTGMFGQAPQQNTGAFGQPAQQNTGSFGQQTPNTGLFGKSQTSTGGGFGQPAASVFGGNTQTVEKGLFGKSPSSNQTPSMGSSAFGQTTFGKQPQVSGGLFGKLPQAATGGLFGKGPQTQTGSVFGGNQTQPSMFGGSSQNQTGAFGVNQAQPATAGFGPTQSQSIPSTVFGQTPSSQPAQTTLFGKPQTQPATLFGKPQTQQSSDPHANLFRPTAPSPAVTTGQQNIQPAASATAVASALYTVLDKLSLEDLEQFKAARFTLGKIPMCPPPVELI